MAQAWEITARTVVMFQAGKAEELAVTATAMVAAVVSMTIAGLQGLQHHHQYMVEHVLAMMPPAMSMHMLASEIQQAQDNGKMYVVTAGMRQSQPGEGSKIIFLMRMLRQANAGFEVPTYDSHSVEVSGSSKKQHCMHMAENSVNFLVHFKKFVRTDYTHGIELWGRDSVHRQQTKLVGHYERVECEQWPANIIQDIVNGTTPCLQGNVLSPHNMTGTTSVVLTPAKPYTESDHIDTIMAECHR